MTKNQKSSTWDPESTAWNPQSKITIGQLLVEELGCFVNRKTQSKPVFSTDQLMTGRVNSAKYFKFSEIKRNCSQSRLRQSLLSMLCCFIKSSQRICCRTRHIQGKLNEEFLLFWHSTKARWINSGMVGL